MSGAAGPSTVGGTRTVVDELGMELEVPVRPSRIVSLVPNLSELLWWYEVADRVVGVTDWCSAPPHGFPNAIRVRGTKNPDTRAIAELGPDLVIANQEENRELDVDRLRDAGLAVYVTAAETVDGACTTFAGLGDLVGASSQARDLLTRVDRARGPSRPTGQRRVRVACAIWRDPWMWVGRRTYVGDLLETSGFEVVDLGDDRYPQAPLGDVRALEPDLVLLPDEPYVFAEDDRDVFADWDAAARLWDGTALTWYGPRTPYAIAELRRLRRSVLRRTRRRAG